MVILYCLEFISALQNYFSMELNFVDFTVNLKEIPKSPRALIVYVDK